IHTQERTYLATGTLTQTYQQCKAETAQSPAPGQFRYKLTGYKIEQAAITPKGYGRHVIKLDKIRLITI
ncbi:hypothetical protein, partial [Kamptonema formosum]|uniref:hypothetical protein n=1 Tax=Kamptonema formosum TaxID=331992 RepID=UPI001E44C321